MFWTQCLGAIISEDVPDRSWFLEWVVESAQLLGISIGRNEVWREPGAFLLLQEESGPHIERFVHAAMAMRGLPAWRRSADYLPWIGMYVSVLPSSTPDTDLSKQRNSFTAKYQMVWPSCTCN